MTNYEFMKFAEFFDEDINPSDFTTEELDQMVKDKMKTNKKYKEKYFEFYDDVKCPTKKTEDW